MNGPGRERKYSDAPKGHTFTTQDVLDHLLGRRTWAVALVGRAGFAVAGCRDYDGDDGAGAVLALKALDTLRAAGVAAVAILLGGRGHIWSLYLASAAAGDIRVQIEANTPAGPGEVYPSGNNIRLPFGLHRIRNTRGVMVFQDGRRFELDDSVLLVVSG